MARICYQDHAAAVATCHATAAWARRRVDPSAFGEDRVVVQFEFTDQPQAKRSSWLINEARNVDLCPKDRF
jgi:hypothetical protein